MVKNTACDGFMHANVWTCTADLEPVLTDTQSALSALCSHSQQPIRALLAQATGRTGTNYHNRNFCPEVSRLLEDEILILYIVWSLDEGLSAPSPLCVGMKASLQWSEEDITTFIWTHESESKLSLLKLS